MGSAEERGRGGGAPEEIAGLPTAGASPFFMCSVLATGARSVGRVRGPEGQPVRREAEARAASSLLVTHLLLTSRTLSVFFRRAFL